MRVKSIITALFLAAAGGAYWWYSQPEPPPNYKTTPITRGDIEEVVTATGTLSALKTVIVGTQTSGIVKEIYVDFNDRVKKDQLLAELDPATFEAQVQQSKANLTTARAQYLSAQGRVEKAEADKKRADDLAQKELISAAERDNARFALEAAKADLVSAEAQVAEANAALKLASLNGTRTKIYSPIDGIIISRKVDVGQTVAASLSAPELFTIAEDLQNMQVIAEIDEADIGRLKEGMSASFTVDAFPGETFQGRVTQLRYSPSTSNSVVTYPAVIVVENPERKLRPGMTVNAEFVSARREGVLRVPNTALRFVPPEGAVKKVNNPKGENGKGENEAGTNRPQKSSNSQASSGPATAQNSPSQSAPNSQPTKPPEKLGQRTGKVYVFRDGTLSGIPVTLGITDGKQTELIDGPLKEKDEVVIEVERANKQRNGSSGSGGPPRTRF